MVEYDFRFDDDFAFDFPSLLQHLGYMIFLLIIFCFLFFGDDNVVLSGHFAAFLDVHLLYFELFESVGEETNSIIESFSKIDRVSFSF